MKVLKENEQFEIEITREVAGLDYLKIGRRFKAVATFIGRHNRECVETEPVYEGDRNTGSHWIHSDNYKRI